MITSCWCAGRLLPNPRRETRRVRKAPLDRMGHWRLGCMRVSADDAFDRQTDVRASGDRMVRNPLRACTTFPAASGSAQCARCPRKYAPADIAERARNFAVALYRNRVSPVCRLPVSAGPGLAWRGLRSCRIGALPDDAPRTWPKL